jgi:hypothetical protein
VYFEEQAYAFREQQHARDRFLLDDSAGVAALDDPARANVGHVARDLLVIGQHRVGDGDRLCNRESGGHVVDAMLLTHSRDARNRP